MPAEARAPPLGTALQSLVVFACLALVAIAQEIIGRAQRRWRGAPLTFASIWERHVYARAKDCWTHVVETSAGSRITVDGRAGVLNFGSYNYLGLEAASAKEICAVHALAKPVVVGAENYESVSRQAVEQLEKRVAAFLGVESACVFASGFATNASSLRTILDARSDAETLGRGAPSAHSTLVLSDEHSHASLAAGRRLAGCTMRVFRHNDVKHLEALLCEAMLARDVPRRIVVVTEALFSMEASIAPLAEIVALKRRYGFYLWLDEAHSIGALGRRGRGLCERAGVSPRDVDVLVGTFSKAFSAVGGYVAGTHAIVAAARRAAARGVPLSAVCCAHVERVLDALEDPLRYSRLLCSLRSNVRTMRRLLRDAGLRVIGDADAPVVPILIYHPARLVAFQRCLLERGVAVVVVGYPATGVLYGRARLCVSAAHSAAEIAHAAQVIVGVARELGMCYDAAGERSAAPI